MQSMKGYRHGQSTAEYAIVIALVLGAVIGMQTYVRRAIQGRVHDATMAHMPSSTMDDTLKTGAGDAGGNTGMFAPSWSKLTRTSFEPYYATAETDTTTKIDSLTPAGADGPIHIEGPARTISAITGGFRTNTNRTGSSNESKAQN